MNQFNLDELCFPMKEKTKKIIGYKKDIIKFKKYKQYKIFLLSTMIILILLLLFRFYYVISIILIILSFMCLCIAYFLDVKYDKVVKKYEKLRLEIIESLKGKICIHHYVCDCKEEYYRYMDSLNIDLIYK